MQVRQFVVGRGDDQAGIRVLAELAVWRATPDYASWAAAGAAASLAAGAIVLGHYLTYWLGVRRRLRRHNEKTAQGSGA